jgi:hypothetical protein
MTEIQGIDWRKPEGQEAVQAALGDALSTLKQLNDPKKLEQWWVKVLFGLAQTLQFSYSSLIEGSKQEAISYCAWCARTLAEAEVWTEYVTRSRDNARRFYDDWLDDLSDLAKDAVSYTEMNEQQRSDTTDIYGQLSTDAEYVQRGRKALEEFKDAAEAADEEYLRISTVARELGLQWFGRYNKYLSKYVHATALSVLSFPSDGHRTNLAHYLLQQGSYSVVRAGASLNEFFKKQGIPYLF